MLALKTGMTWPQIQEWQPGEAERDEEANVLPREQRGRGLANTLILAGRTLTPGFGTPTL